MGSISDIMLTSGVGILVPILHGEIITVLNGLDAGNAFTAVIEIEHDMVLADGGVGMDRRAKRVARFTAGSVPRFTGKAQIQTGDGKKWLVIDDPQTGYVTTDFEIQEIPDEDQT